MNIIGEKVLLRAIELSDKDMLLDIINDGETEFLLGGWSFPVSSLNQEEWIKSLKPNHQTLRCMVMEKSEDRAVGTVILSDIDYKNGNAEIHVKMAKDYRGRGFALDAVQSLTKYSFDELRMKCIYAHINAANVASLRLFEKCGFENEGVLRSRLFKKGNYHDIIVLSKLSGV